MDRYVKVWEEYHVLGLYDLGQLREHEGALALDLVRKDGRLLRVTFDGFLAYRSTDEGDLLRSLASIEATVGLGHSFYRVEESSFAAWLAEQSHGVRDSSGLVHYAVLTIDRVIDVLALAGSTPRFELLE